MDPSIIKSSVCEIARDMGFSDCRIAASKQASSSEHYIKWLDQGMNAGMEWMARNVERRCNPDLVLDGCKSVICLSFPYGSRSSRDAGEGSIALYAHGGDYHSLLESKLNDLCEILSNYGGEHRFYVDAGPVMERDFAVDSGIGWRGKSGLVVREVGGSRFFLGVILTTLELPVDMPVRNRCGFCQRCVQSCPTDAILSDGSVDARKCLSYWTIEHRGVIPEEWRKAIGDRLYGCDTCSKVCPWTRKTQVPFDNYFSLPKQLRDISLEKVLSLSEEEFRDLFRNSPIKRVKWQGLIRNACIVAGNSGNSLYIKALTSLLNGDDVISEHAQWALGQIHQKDAPKRGES